MAAAAPTVTESGVIGTFVAFFPENLPQDLEVCVRVTSEHSMFYNTSLMATEAATFSYYRGESVCPTREEMQPMFEGTRLFDRVKSELSKIAHLKESDTSSDDRLQAWEVSGTTTSIALGLFRHPLEDSKPSSFEALSDYPNDKFTPLFDRAPGHLEGPTTQQTNVEGDSTCVINFVYLPSDKV